MTLLILGLLRYCLVLVFGVAVSLLFSGVRMKRAGALVATCFCILVLLVQVALVNTMGMEFTTQIYPAIAHLPLFLLLTLYFKRPWLISLCSILTAYLCCQVPRWMGAVVSAISGSLVADHIGYILTMVVVYYILKKYLSRSVLQLMERSSRSCLLFGAVPLLYYVFDYSTTVYTDLLYSGARGAVQFMPSLVCTFYFVFVLLYYAENTKQTAAQRERDILASQLQQAQSELENMRQLENSTVLYRHDMRHHLSLLGGLAADGDIQKISEYLARTQADINALTPARYCENETANLILSTFDARARTAGVTLCVNVELPVKLRITDTELCSLLSNALENAITAAAQVAEKTLRKVYICAVVNGGKLVISTENAYAGRLELEDEIPKPQRKDPGHGFGIKSMLSIVKRYGGLYSFETADGIFILRLLLPQETEKEGHTVQPDTHEAAFV